MIEQRKGQLFWEKGGWLSEGICDVKPPRWWEELCFQAWWRLLIMNMLSYSFKYYLWD